MSLVVNSTAIVCSNVGSQVFQPTTVFRVKTEGLCVLNIAGVLTCVHKYHTYLRFIHMNSTILHA